MSCTRPHDFERPFTSPGPSFTSPGPSFSPALGPPSTPILQALARPEPSPAHPSPFGHAPAQVDGVAPAMLLDFLSSVCKSGKKGHERMQNAIGQLLCGLVSEGGDPHMSSLVYHLRLLAAPAAERPRGRRR